VTDPEWVANLRKGIKSKCLYRDIWNLRVPDLLGGVVTIYQVLDIAHGPNGSLTAPLEFFFGGSKSRWVSTLGVVSLRYTISSRYDLADAAIVATAHREMQTEGVCMLPGFLTDAAVREMVAECDQLAPLAHRSAPRRNPYLTKASGGNGTATAVLYDSLEVLAYDHFPTSSPLRRLYESDEILQFIRRCLGVESLYRYADPFGALNVSIMREGDMLDWHFDMTDFVVSIALQSSTAGGEFENVPRIRDAGEVAIAALLAGDRRGVRVEPMTPGTLMLFNGRRSMHRVSPVGGDVPRYVALLAYDTKPRTDSTDELKLSRYGRLPKR